MMFKLCVFVMLAMWWSVAARRGGRPGPGPRRPRVIPLPRGQMPLSVYKGKNDTTGRFPYVVALLSRRLSWGCTGTLISSTWVLTASRCMHPTYFYAIQYDNMTIPGNQSNNISRILELHSLYGWHELFPRNDIGLIKVEPVQLRVYGNISAVDYRTMTGHAVEYAGYGSTGSTYQHLEQNPTMMDQRRVLQLGEGSVVPCEAEYSLPKQHICVAPKCSNSQQDTLPGDPGCPLIHDGKLIGVLMGGVKPPVSMYTPVSRYLNWIHGVIGS